MSVGSLLVPTNASFLHDTPAGQRVSPLPLYALGYDQFAVPCRWVTLRRNFSLLGYRPRTLSLASLGIIPPICFLWIPYLVTSRHGKGGGWASSAQPPSKQTGLSSSLGHVSHGQNQVMRLRPGSCVRPRPNNRDPEVPARLKIGFMAPGTKEESH